MTLIDKIDLLTSKDGRVTTHFNEVIERTSLFYMETNHLSEVIENFTFLKDRFEHLVQSRKFSETLKSR